MKRLKKNGFTLIESLLSLLVCSIVSMIALIFIQCCLQIVSLKPMHQNQMAILQLRQILALSHDIHIEDNQLKMIYGHSEIVLMQDKNRLVQRDGYVIWMEGIDDVYFKEVDDEIFIQYSYNAKRYEAELS